MRPSPTSMSSATNSVSPDIGSIRLRRLRLAIVVIGSLIILAFDGSSAYDAWRSYRYSIDATNREIDNVANALSEQTAWALQAVDLLLLDTARWYRSDGGGLTPERVNAVLGNRAPIFAIPSGGIDQQQIDGLQGPRGLLGEGVRHAGHFATVGVERILIRAPGVVCG